MVSTTPSSCSGMRSRFAARSSFSTKSLSSLTNASWLSISFSSFLTAAPPVPDCSRSFRRSPAAAPPGKFVLRVVERLGTGVPVHSGIVDPDSVVLLRRLEQPVDRRLPPALSSSASRGCPRTRRPRACGSSPAGFTPRISQASFLRWHRPVAQMRATRPGGGR